MIFFFVMTEQEDTEMKYQTFHKDDDLYDQMEESDIDEDTVESEDNRSNHSMEVSSSPDDDDEEEEDDDSSDITDEEFERRRVMCNRHLFTFESNFAELKEKLYSARMEQIKTKKEELQKGTMQEYLQGVERLENELKVRQQVAEVLHGLKLKNIKNIREAEEQSARQNYESEKSMLTDSIYEDLQEKIRRLEEDRNNADIHSDLWWSKAQQPQVKKKKTKQPFDPLGLPERRKKPVTVTGPYIVYMLHDEEILDDWTSIKKAVKQAEKQEKRKNDSSYVGKSAENYPYKARYEDEKLYYEGDWYSKGHRIVIHHGHEQPVHATITALNTGEVWIKRTDGGKSKLYINQLQKGKYSIQHRPSI